MSELAINDDNVVAHTGDEQLVTMRVDDQLFGLPILSAQDIVETQKITQVPMAPSAVAGVMNLRGRIVTVVNLRRILGQEENFASRMGVTVEHDGDLYTILVDEIGEVMSVASEDLEPVPTTLNSGLKNLCSGIYRLESGLLALLDINRILDAETILQTPQIDFVARKRLLETPVAEDANESRRTGKSHMPDKDDPVAETPEVKRCRPVDSLDADPGSAAYASVIEAAVELFYEKVSGDESLAGFFEGVDMDRQRTLLNDVMSMAIADPGQDSARPLDPARVRLENEKELGNEHFDAVAGHLQSTLRDLNVADNKIEEVLSSVSGLRGGVPDD